MNTYSQVPTRGDPNDSHFGPSNPPVSINYQQPVGILHGPGYKMVQTQSKVHKYSWYIKLFGWIFIIFGGLRALSNAIKFLEADEVDIEFDDSRMENNEIEIPAAPLAIASFLEFVSGCLLILMGYLFIKTAEAPTRSSTWKLWKNTLLIIIGKFICLVLAYLAIFIGFGMAFDDWVRDERRSPGEYRLTHQKSGHEFRFRKHGANHESHQNDDMREMEDISKVIFMGVIMAFSIACCCTTMCSACILGGLYKFHYSAKELEIIQGLPSVNQVNMQQMPQYQVHPQAPNLVGGIVRGHVVALPPQNEP
ncbi:unnamed protein product [Moneuplotes crassus]|uniref:Uncharacterized protein n=1 Tax=Euplotes crassus TaxID=5936 RepID=A0AAD1UIP3_EUPCR|nr:unnamed protein product [Moneuplotes crassus]